MKAHQHFLPMKTAGTQNFIERTYRESGVYQWVREAWKNAEEAGATRIEYGIEWQAVESRGVYRRLIADNGRGMNAEELQAFFNTFGGGGKPIGGEHENFGVGSKTSLLPWNHHGVVVISWVDGDPSMIWVQRNPETGEYGLRVLSAEDPATGEISLEAVYEPFDDPDHGCDWALVKPDFIEEHGTVMVLLGSNPQEDTVLGDPSREEDEIKGISAYLNKRVWQVGEGVEFAVDELRTIERSAWPRSADEAHSPAPKGGVDRRTNNRTIRGAKYFIEYPDRVFKQGRLSAKGTTALSDGTEIDWYLWSKDRPAVHSYAALNGYVAALYKNELYDVMSHMATYRSFGISEKAVRERVWLVIRPPQFSEVAQRGVYPRTDRNSLLIRGGPRAGEPLPYSEWAAEFAENMPDEIREAVRAARVGQEGTLADDSWRERLAERFGARWRILKLRLFTRGRYATSPGQPGETSAKATTRKKPEGKGGTSGNRDGGPHGELTLGGAAGTLPAQKVKVGGGVPTYRPVRAADVEEGMLAAWVPNDPTNPEGVVLLNTEHPVIENLIQYWQSKYPDQHAEAIANDVVEVYGQIAVAKIAHSEHLKGILPSKTVENELRSSGALTMALLGLVAEEAVIATRVGGKYGRSRTSA